MGAPRRGMAERRWQHAKQWRNEGSWERRLSPVLLEDNNTLSSKAFT